MERRDRGIQQEVRSFPHERLTVCDANPGVQRLLSQIRSSESRGQDMRQQLYLLGFMLGAEYLSSLDQQPQNSSLLAIPRGGSAMGQGLEHLTGISCVYTNDGAERNASLPLLPDTFALHQKIDTVVLTDAITATGSSVDRTIEAVSSRNTVNEFVLITAIASPIGVQNLLGKYKNLTIVAGCVEPKYEWVEKDGKQVLFVEGVGDIGDLVSIS